jgi:hypothetical protein
MGRSPWTLAVELEVFVAGRVRLADLHWLRLDGYVLASQATHTMWFLQLAHSSRRSQRLGCGRSFGGALYSAFSAFSFCQDFSFVRLPAGSIRKEQRRGFAASTERIRILASLVLPAAKTIPVL